MGTICVHRSLWWMGLWLKMSSHSQTRMQWGGFGGSNPPPPFVPTNVFLHFLPPPPFGSDDLFSLLVREVHGYSHRELFIVATPVESLERLVMYDGYPYSMSGKLTQHFLGMKKGVPTPPPPPHSSSHQMFLDWHRMLSKICLSRFLFTCLEWSLR